MKRIDVRELELRHQHAGRADPRAGSAREPHDAREDRMRAVELKKQRLATKDQLYAMRGRR